VALHTQGVTLVWYAAYGSNLDRRRMLCYVQGGRPPGATRTYQGCTDPSPPRDDRPVTLPYPLYFGDRSSVWGGGVAFVDRERDQSRETLGRAWLLTTQQFADVLHQENGRPPVGEPIDLRALRDDGEFTLGDGWYEHLLLCADEGGVPVVTLTSARPHPPTAPAAAYVACMVTGLVEAHGLGVEEARAYVQSHVSG